MTAKEYLVKVKHYIRKIKIEFIYNNKLKAMKNNFTHTWKMFFLVFAGLFYSVGSLQAQCASSGITLSTGTCFAPTLPNDSIVCSVTISLGMNTRLTLQNAQPNIGYEAYYANTPGSFVTVFDTNNVQLPGEQLLYNLQYPES